MAGHQHVKPQAPWSKADKVLFGKQRRFSRDRFCVPGFHMGLANAFQGHEAPDRIGHLLSYREYAVIAQDDRPVVSQGFRNPGPRLYALNLYFLVIKQGVVLKKYAGLLCDWLDRAQFR